MVVCVVWPAKSGRYKSTALNGPAEFTVPVNDGDSSGAFRSNADCVAVDIGFAGSLCYPHCPIQPLPL
jgi:hypothetical protein